MSQANIITAGTANRGVEKVFRRSGTSLPPSQAIARVARAIWPVKTDKELAVRTRTSDRAIRELLADRGGLSLVAVANLLRSEEGYEFLEALLGDASPAWRKKLELHVDISLARFAIEEQRRRVADLEAKAGAELSTDRFLSRR